MKRPGSREQLPRIVTALLVSLLAISAEASQQAPNPAPVDLNSYYRFPFSMGVEYRSLNPFGAFGKDFNIFSVQSDFRLPLPALPRLQPTVSLGYTQADDRVEAKWSHQLFSASLGIGWAERFSRNFELGAELLGGAGEAVYPQLDPAGPQGSPTLLAEAGARISLDPSYGISVDLHPSLSYRKSLSPLGDFDGLSFGLGFSIHYRFGEDPDAPQSAIRSLRFEDPRLPPAFSSMQSYYSKNPLGRISLVNTEAQALEDIEVAFDQKGYMDAPTPSFSLARLAAGARVQVPLKAVFNAEVFKLTGGFKPMTGEVIVSYRRGGRVAEQRYAVNYDLYDKTAMTWDDDRKAAAFITTLDSALQNYSAFIGEAGKPAILADYNRTLQTVMLTYDALREIGMFYQEDPTAPITRVQADPTFVDFISMPRLTLKRRYGDCKNLTVLFCSLLETRGIKTGFITLPGHIFPVVDTGLPAAEWRQLSPDRTMTLALGDTLWVPVEITMLDGRSDFLAAWRQAVAEWKQNGEKRAFYATGEAQAVYSPVAVEDQDLGLQYGSAEGVAGLFRQDLDAQAREVLAGYSAAASSAGDKGGWNRLGMMAARLGRLADAEGAFARALKIDASFMPAQVNLANVSFLKGDFSKAAGAYQQALKLIGSPARGSLAAGTEVAILLNLAHAWTALKDSQRAEAFLAQANSLDPERVRSTGEAPAGSTGTRAANASGQASGLNFLEEE
jgi:tetratricopeptide (TPR) repeat protein